MKTAKRKRTSKRKEFKCLNAKLNFYLQSVIKQLKSIKKSEKNQIKQMIFIEELSVLENVKATVDVLECDHVLLLRTLCNLEKHSPSFMRCNLNILKQLLQYPAIVLEGLDTQVIENLQSPKQSDAMILSIERESYTKLQTSDDQCLVREADESTHGTLKSKVLPDLVLKTLQESAVQCRQWDCANLPTRSYRYLTTFLTVFFTTLGNHYNYSRLVDFTGCPTKRFKHLIFCYSLI